MHEVEDVFMHAFDFEVLFLTHFVDLVDEGGEIDRQVIDADDHVHCKELTDDGLVDVLDVETSRTNLAPTDSRAQVSLAAI